MALHVARGAYVKNPAERDGAATSVTRRRRDDADRTTSKLQAASLHGSPDVPPVASSSRPLAQLVVLRGQQPGQRYPLGDHSTIGRGSACRVVLDDERASRSHAVIQRVSDTTWTLSDLGSRNGTQLNGANVESTTIHFGDRLQIGATVLLFSHADPLEERIQHQQKLEAIGRLGAGVAHDINNVLGGILMNADYLLGLGARSLTDPEVRDCLHDLRAATALGADLTRRILAVARRSTTEHAQVDLSTLVHDTLALARRTFDRSIVFDVTVAPQIHVRGDRGQLQQVVMNLLLNARDAMPSGGTLRVSLGHARASEVDDDLVAVAGLHARLLVSDNGVGMDEATRARAFEPFFTTKEPDGGMGGVGLSSVLSVVTAHGGTVSCESTVDRGCTFRVVLPALIAAARAEIPTPLAPRRPGAPPLVVAPAYILVVDDEPLSRRGLCRLLERDGHRTAHAADGREALAAYQKETFDLVIMDLDMPSLDGQEAFARMREIAPETLVVFVTGFVSDARRRELVEAGASAILDKPCEASVLRDAVNTALDRRQRASLASSLPTREERSRLR
jgi:signal transduction histidine kinase/ActR/RegA family two-component response regulator